MNPFEFAHALLCPMHHAPEFRALPLRILAVIPW